MAEGVGSLAKDIRAAITGPEMTAEQKAQIEMQLLVMESAAAKAAADFDAAQMQGQVDLNKIEAGSDSIFKSGWRPAVGWICVAGLTLTFLVKPLLPWICQVGALMVGRESIVPPIPEIPMNDLLILLSGLLGLGTMRSVEKIKGTR
ncbi:MAG: hypothetical protein A2Y38_24985 [Spirochaetes bacterium GWB1_59_5]|nr:MAG: hypothetical protein A2Y38_24985 [Spirochaetes bacterium GWB1_59_5]